MVEGAGESESDGEKGKPAAIFIAFGTQGDVYPIVVSIELLLIMSFSFGCPVFKLPHPSTDDMDSSFACLDI